MLSPMIAPATAAAMTGAMLSPRCPACKEAMTKTVSPGRGTPMLSKPIRNASAQYPYSLRKW